MQVDFPGITIEWNDSALVLRSSTRLHTLSSAVVGGGFAEVEIIINRYVSKNYDRSDPAADLVSFAHSRGIEDAFVGLLTAVKMYRARSLTIRDGELTVSAVITAGVNNASAAGVTKPHSAVAGTINMVLLIDGDLTPAAMVNAVKTAAEAEAAVLFERRVQTPEGLLATGTSTDAIVIACTGRGVPLAYAGPVTQVGYLIGRCVRGCLMAALDAD